MKDEILKTRISDAKSIEKKIKAIEKSLYGKAPARLIDSFIKVRLEAQVNRQNLEFDWAYRKDPI